MVLEKETALFNEGAIDSGIEDAGTKATNYLSADGTGIMVEKMTNGTIELPSEATGQNVHVTNTAVNIRNGQTVLARFGESSQIGEDNKSRIEIDTNSITGYNDDSVKYFDIDMSAGSKTETTRVGRIFGRSNKAASIIWPVPELTTSYTQVGPELSWTVTNDIPFVTTGTVIRVSDYYFSFFIEESDFEEVAYTTGSNCRYAGGGYAALVYPTLTSFTIGTNSTEYAEAHFPLISGGRIDIRIEFTYTASTNVVTITAYARLYDGASAAVDNSNGMIQFSCGVTTTAPAIALGTRDDETPGIYSATIGEHLIAAGDDQIAMGKFNVEDANDEFAVIVGNGTADSARSNALTVDWSGNLEAAGDVTDGSGNVLSDKADASDVKEIMVASVSLSSVTLTANGGTGSATGSVARSGYTPLGIIGVQKSGSGNGQASVTAFMISGTTATVSLYNHATASRTVGVTVYVLYKAS